MKSFSCKDMGGVCDMVFSGETPEEVMKKGSEHVMKMAHEGDEAHKRLKKMMDDMQGTDAEKDWMNNFQKQWGEKVED